MDKLFPNLDEMIDLGIAGELNEEVLADSVDEIVRYADLKAEEIDEVRASSPHLSAYVIARQLHACAKILTALEKHCARLRSMEHQLRAALVEDQVAGRILPAYLYEFALRVQASGASQEEIRALTKKRLADAPEALTNILSKKSGEAPIVHTAPQETAESPHSPSADYEISPEFNDPYIKCPAYSIGLRPATDEDVQVQRIRLPPLKHVHDFETDNSYVKYCIEQSVRSGDLKVFEENVLPNIEEYYQLCLSAYERKIWAFLLVFRHLEQIDDVVAERLGLSGMVIPVSGHDNLVWQVYCRD